MPVADVPALLGTHSLLAYPTVFAAGLLTSLTPCIYPMIPITAAVIGGQARSATADARPAASRVRVRAWSLTGAYVLGLSLTYAALGLIAGLTGQLFGSVSTNPWLLLGMANLLLVFALMMLDVIAVPVPTQWLTRAATLDGGGRLAGALLMGAASGLVAAPCGAPVMGTLLTWVGASQDAWRGFSYLFVFSLGMSSLLVVVGLAAGSLHRLPRAGAWMTRVKMLFALLMVGAAEYYFVQAGQVWF